MASPLDRVPGAQRVPKTCRIGSNPVVAPAQRFPLKARVFGVYESPAEPPCKRRVRGSSPLSGFFFSGKSWKRAPSHEGARRARRRIPAPWKRFGSIRLRWKRGRDNLSDGRGRDDTPVRQARLPAGQRIEDVASASGVSHARHPGRHRPSTARSVRRSVASPGRRCRVRSEPAQS
jgi:hypothetical protein